MYFCCWVLGTSMCTAEFYKTPLQQTTCSYVTTDIQKGGGGKYTHTHTHQFQEMHFHDHKMLNDKVGLFLYPRFFVEKSYSTNLVTLAIGFEWQVSNGCYKKKHTQNSIWMSNDQHIDFHNNFAIVCLPIGSVS